MLAGEGGGGCRRRGGGGLSRAGTSKRSYEDQRQEDTEAQAGNGGHVRRNNRAKERLRECGFCSKTMRKTAKEIQSSLTFTVPGPLPKAV